SRNNKQIEKNAKKDNPNPISYTTLSYIEAFKTVAITEMNKYGIPASITLAQGILESGSGGSDLAKYANNHFGIKCTSDWKGKAYYKDDDQRDDCFRVYKDPQESYKDHSEFLKRKRYAALFELDKNDYRNWALGLKNAGYATNPKYPDLLINIIEKYQLYQYDQSESEREKLAREDKVLKEINTNIPNEKKLYTPVAVAPKDPPTTLENGKYHNVQQGETLYKISQIYKISVDELKSLNQLPDNNIKIGQKLLVVK
ncbi:MAG: LysM peptidoglycan-binding domain-containing protein, partial [Flavobacteriales bacterium]